MKYAVLIAVIAAALTPLSAQEATAPAGPAASMPFAVRPPDENSPFFLDRSLEARYSAAQADEVARFPRTKNSEDTAFGMIKGFFTGMFSSINIGPLRSPPTVAQLEVSPSQFNLKERREVGVVYTIRNTTKKIQRIDYPTTQRIDILTYDPQGRIIDRWSDDRASKPEEGVVVINPGERIEYNEKIPTREMKAGETYRIKALATTQPDFAVEKTVSPQ